MVPSATPGMGSIFTGNKTTFRVWAKFADSVAVAGSFNNWSVTSHLLASEGNGYWSGDVAEAGVDDSYRYFIVGKSAPAGLWKTDPYCKSVLDNANSDGRIVTSDFNWSTDHFRMPSWNELVIYELHTASFNRSNAQPGNFNSIIDKLDYLVALGINAIQILPVFKFPGQFSLGYNPSFPFDIESPYGTATEFKDFVKAAHAKGIAIVLDIVLNHFGPDDLGDSLWQFDGWNENGKGGIYFYNDWKSEATFPNRPDFGRPEVRNFLKDNTLLWLEEYHIDGLRFDSTVNIRNVKGQNSDPAHDLPEGWSLMQWLNDTIDAKMPWKITIAEDLQNNEWINKSTGEGGAGFDSQWDSYFYWNLYNAIVTYDDKDRSMTSLKDVMLHQYGSDNTQKVIYFNNHDECAAINKKFRLTDRIWFANTETWLVKKRYTLAAAIVFTAPGIPLIFMGDEFFENGSWQDSGSLDWGKLQRFSGIWDCFQSLIRLRRNWYNNTRGLRGQHVNVFHTNETDKLIAWHRWQDGGPGDDVIIVANFSNRSYNSYHIGFPQQGTWYVRFNSDWNGYDSDFSNSPGYDTTASENGQADGLPCGGNIGIAAYSLIILSQ